LWPADLDESCWKDSRILHFGYPPLMREIAADGGRGLAEKFAEVQSSGLLVSLDMAMCAEGTPERATNWKQWLRQVLPHVDLFLPSVDEIMLMLADEPDLHSRSVAHHNSATAVFDTSHLAKLADKLLGFGVPIVLIKLGEQGLYLRTSENVSMLSSRAVWHDFDWRPWRNRELLAPCFNVDVVGTTGAGDCAIAGFLMAMLRSQPPEAAICCAASVASHCVQSADATSNIPSWSEIESADLKSQPKREATICTPGWRFFPEQGVHAGPADAILQHIAK
jgi:sugar/nucleoside kinase (ribokinase family)